MSETPRQVFRSRRFFPVDGPDAGGPSTPPAPPNFSNVWFGPREPFYGPGHPAVKAEAIIDQYDGQVYRLEAQIRSVQGNQAFMPQPVAAYPLSNGVTYEDNASYAAASGQPEPGDLTPVAYQEDGSTYWFGFYSELANDGIYVPVAWTEAQLMAAPATGFEVLAQPYSERASDGEFMDGVRMGVYWSLKSNGTWYAFSILNDKNILPRSEVASSLGVVTPEMTANTKAYFGTLVGGVENMSGFGLGFQMYTVDPNLINANDLGMTLYGVTPGEYDVLKYPYALTP